jgi:flagellar protein FlbB
MLHKDPQTSTTATQSKPFVANLDEDRLRKQREALDIYKEELDKRETDIDALEKQNEQIAAELAEREKNQEEREKTFNQTVKRYDDINVNVEQIAKNLNGMRPEASVAILEALDDQTVIDVLRKVEELAAASGSSSMGSYWLSLMDSKRAAEIQRKMISKPESLE